VLETADRVVVSHWHQTKRAVDFLPPPCRKTLVIGVGLLSRSDETNEAGEQTPFCRAMLCISAAYAVMRCLSLSLSLSLSLCVSVTFCQNE